MKRIYLLFCSFLFINTYAKAQDSAYLDIGNIRALVYSNGNFFNDKNAFSSSYEVPVGTNLHTIYSSSFWLSSESVQNGTKRIAASYATIPFYDNLFNSGPVDVSNQIADSSAAFQRVWKINQSEIDDHIQNWNTSNYAAPPSILDWPGNGKQNQKLAPFNDLDNDNLYEPQDGEHPIIKGDQAIFLMLNDYRPDSTIKIPRPFPLPDSILYDFVPLKVELHVMLYAFDSNVEAIANTTFVQVKVFKRSTSILDDHNDFRFSVLTNFDIGQFGYDDYSGTDTSHNLYYAYNAQPSFSAWVYPMAQGVQFLDYKIDHSISYTSGLSANGDPVLPDHYSGYQRAIWLNDQPMYYGGDAFSYCVDTSKITTVMYSGNPTLVNDTTQWTEINPCLNSSSLSNPSRDQIMVGGPNVPRNFGRNDVIEINYAYVFANDDSTTITIDPINKLFLTADTVQNFFDNNLITSIQSPISPEVSFNLFPNPANQRIQLRLKESNFEISIFDISGAEVLRHRNTKSIDVSDLAKGIYFVQVRTAHQIGTKKLIIAD